jgi:hypothetical protein
MKNSSPASRWVQLEIPGLFEQLEKSSDINSQKKAKDKYTRRLKSGATQTKSACAD